MNKIYYFDKVTPVELGDVVETRLFFKKKTGRIVYVPGVSTKHEDMEHDGLSWVGIRLPDGSFIATVVDPKEYFLQKRIKFIEHNSIGFREVQSDDKLFDE